MAATAHADDDAQSQQEYLDAVNSEAMRIKPYMMPVITDAPGSAQGADQTMNVEEMVSRLKKLTPHTNH